MKRKWCDEKELEENFRALKGKGAKNDDTQGENDRVCCYIRKMFWQRTTFGQM